MPLKETIKKDLLKASKEGDKTRVATLRMLISEINQAEIEEGKKGDGLSDDEVGKIVLQEIKKRTDSEEQYNKGGREDLAAKEAEEREILEEYAPKQLTDEEISSLIRDTIKETGASGMEDMGTVMRGVMEKVGNQADGAQVKDLVQKELQSL